jgi:hypothetical protein
MRTGRLEKRAALSVPLRFSSTDRPGEAEATTTENVSSCGARVVTHRPLRPDQELLVTLRGAAMPTPARVVYCQALSTGSFGSRLEQDEPKTLEEIGKRWGVSRERVRQVELRTKQFLSRHLSDAETDDTDAAA